MSTFCSSKAKAEEPTGSSAFALHFCLFHAVFVGLDHLFNHLATDRTGLTGSEVAVITLFEVYANFACCFLFNSFKSLFSLFGRTLILHSFVCFAFATLFLHRSKKI